MQRAAVDHSARGCATVREYALMQDSKATYSTACRKAGGTTDPYLKNTKNSELVRAAFTAASLSIICLLDGLALTKSGSVRVPLNALIDASVFTAYIASKLTDISHSAPAIPPQSLTRSEHP